MTWAILPLLAVAVTLPAPTGKHAVGRRLMHLVDAGRVDPTRAEEGAKREFMALVWYPAAASSSPASWMPEPWAAAEIEQLFYQKRRSRNPLTMDEAARAVRDVQSHAAEGVAVSTARERWPVLLFGPGAGTNPVFYTSLCEELASHGYVVMATVPTGWVAMAVFPDGHQVPWSRKRSDDPAWINGAALPLWAGDYRFLLDHAASLDGDRRDIFYRRLDLGRVGALGQSFGGTTALRAGRRDDRVKAVCDLDGSPLAALGEDGLGKPLLALVHDMSPANEPLPTDATARKLQVEAQSELADVYRKGKPGYRVRIEGSRHMTFSDMSVLPAWSSAARRLGKGEEDGPGTIQVIREHVVQFFDRFLLGRPAPLLERKPGVYGIVELQIAD